MRARSTLALLSLAGVTFAGATALPASADLTTSCVGTAGAVTVPGDLVVPKDQSCNLEGTTVEGKVTVRAGADLIATDATFNDAVVVAEDGYFDVNNTTIAGNVRSNGGYGVYLDGSTVGGSYTGKAPADEAVAPFAFVDGTSVAKAVNVESGELFFEDSEVSGAVTGSGSAFTDVINSSLLKGLTVESNELGSVVCGSEVLGDVSYDGNDKVQLGGGGLLDDCEDANYFGGDVTVSNSTGGVVVNGNIIQGGLAGESNDPAPTGADNRVRGELGGQFVDLEPTPEAKARAQVQDRSADAASKAEDRKQSAVADADKAGPANL